MNCDVVAEHLSDYLDKEREAVACQQIEDHVAQCRTCRGLMSENLAIS